MSNVHDRRSFLAGVLMLAFIAVISLVRVDRAGQMLGQGANNKIEDGYIEWQMYRRERGGWVPDRIQRQTMIVTGSCPRCSRPMPVGTVNCKNCGAEMDPLGSECENRT